MIINGNAISKDRLDTDKLSVFIRTNESECQMKVYSDINNTNSCGKITDVAYKYIREILDVPSTISYKFNWHFSNNYDDETGIAGCMETLINIDKIIKIGLAILLLLCLIDMPCGFYQLVRFLSLIGFGFLAF